MSERRISVLFLTRYPVEGASSRYRVFQYLPHLEAMGIDCEVQSFMDPSFYRLSQQKGRTAAKVLATLRATLRRLTALSRWRRFDLLYLQRELLPFGPPLIERWLKRRGAVLLFDYDDALFIGKPSRYTPIASWLRSPGKTRELLSLADLVIAGNGWLAAQAIDAGGRAVVVEVAEDVERYRPRNDMSADAVVTIGWLGSPSTSKYLQLIAGPLVRVAARHPDVRFEIVGGGGVEMPGVSWHETDWSRTAEIEALQRFDIGLMPLPREEWSLGKSGGKARTYMAAGVVPVCQAIGYNLELIRSGETGFLCDGESDWEETLEKLLTDGNLRRRIGAAAREEVRKRFDPQQQARTLVEIFEEIVDRQGDRGQR